MQQGEIVQSQEQVSLDVHFDHNDGTLGLVFEEHHHRKEQKTLLTIGSIKPGSPAARFQEYEPPLVRASQRFT